MSTATVLFILFGILIFWYKLDSFGWTEVIILSVILLFFVVIILLVYFNQNKIIYMPRINHIIKDIPDQAKSPSGNPFGYKHPG